MGPLLTIRCRLLSDTGCQRSVKAICFCTSLANAHYFCSSHNEFWLLTGRRGYHKLFRCERVYDNLMICFLSYIEIYMKVFCKVEKRGVGGESGELYYLEGLVVSISLLSTSIIQIKLLLLLMWYISLHEYDMVILILYICICTSYQAGSPANCG